MNMTLTDLINEWRFNRVNNKLSPDLKKRMEVLYSRRDERKKIALLVSGYETRFIDDILYAYNVFNQHGFDEVFTLAQDKNYDHSDYTEPLLEALTYVIGTSDTFSLVLRGHGEVYNGQTVFPTGEDGLTESEWQGYLNRINPELGFYLFDCCFSGGYLDEGPGIRVTSTDGYIRSRSAGIKSLTRHMFGYLMNHSFTKKNIFAAFGYAKGFYEGSAEQNPRIMSS